MRRRPSAIRSALALVALTVLVGTALTVTAGCKKKSPARTPPAPAAAPGSDLTAPQSSGAPADEQSMEAYVASLTELGDVLEGVTSKLDAATSTPRIKSLIDDAKRHWAALEDMNPEAASQLSAAFSDRLGPAVDQFKAQVDRISNDLGLGDISSLLDGVPLPGSS